jgi:hypothetical protein
MSQVWETIQAELEAPGAGVPPGSDNFVFASQHLCLQDDNPVNGQSFATELDTFRLGTSVRPFSAPTLAQPRGQLPSFLFLPSLLCAQHRESASTFKVDVKLVNVFVTVTDEHGAPVGGSAAHGSLLSRKTWSRGELCKSVADTGPVPFAIAS